jgi:hypothetical protein
MDNWRLPFGCDDPWMQQISQRFSDFELRKLCAFPDLRTDQQLILASDYAGEHRDSDYQVATFLLTTASGLAACWDRQREAIREKHLSDGARTMAFKNLADGSRQRAIVPFLNACTSIPGIIFCVAIDKTLMRSPLGYHINISHDMKPRVFARLTRIAMLGSILVGGLSDTGQDIHWITDEDDFVCNERIAGQSMEVLALMLRRFQPGLGMVELGIAGKFVDNKRAEDLCAIPDLVGGAIAENLSSLDKAAIPRSAEMFTPVFKRPNTKTALILGWFSSLKSGPLTKLLCLVRPDSHGGFLYSFADPNFGVDDTTSQLWVPIDKGWARAAEAWFE